MPSHRVASLGAALAVTFVALPTPTGTEAAPVASATGSADLVIVNADIITIARAAPARATALAVTDGLIVAVGDESDVDPLIGAGTQVIDLGGATVIPGLVDAHSHFFEEGHRQGIGAAIQDAEILRNGITTTAEFHAGPDVVEMMQDYNDAGELRVRTSLYLTYTDSCGERQGDWWKAYPPTREPGELLRIGGIKVFADGGACNVPAVSFTYDDGSTGDLYFDADALEAIIREVEAEGHQVAVHALGDRAVEATLDAMERVIGDGGNPLRHRIDHNAVVRPDLYGRHQDSGAVAVLFGAFRTCSFVDANNDYLYRTPPEFQAWEWPWRQVIDSNPATTFAWHADYPALPASLGANLAGLVTRADGSCQPTPDIAAGAITVDEALRMMTMGSAYALGRDEEVGSLEVGKFADLAVLSLDPRAVDPSELASIEVLMTMVGGRVEFCHEAFAATCEHGAPHHAPAPPGGSTRGCQPGSENVALGTAVSASASLDDRPATDITDGDTDTGWGAGAGPEQWIEVDLGAERAVTCVRLLVDQFPEGRTVHRLNGGDHPDPGAELGVFDSVTDAGDWLELPGNWTFRYLRITTLESPSWVAWLEVEVH